MDTITHATVVTWLEDAETHGDDYAPISHSSSQVCERPEYVPKSSADSRARHRTTARMAASCAATTSLTTGLTLADP